MAEIRKFLFDLRFDSDQDETETPPMGPGPMTDADAAAAWSSRPDPDQPPQPEMEEEVPPPPPPEMFTATQIEAAREEGYIGGHTAALDEAAAATERMAAMALTEIGRGLDVVQSDHSAMEHRIAADAIRLVSIVTRKILPNLADQAAADELATLVKGLLPQVMDQPRLVARAHPEVAPMVRDRLEQLVTDMGFEGKVTVFADGALALADGKIEWGDGGIERDVQRQWDEIQSHIDAHILQLDMLGERSPEEAPDITPTPVPQRPEPDPDADLHGERISASVDPSATPTADPLTAAQQPEPEVTARQETKHG